MICSKSGMIVLNAILEIVKLFREKMEKSHQTVVESFGPTHQTQVWGEMQTISFLRRRLNHNSSELSHNFQNWNLDTFLPSLTVAYSSVFREKTAQMILGNPNWGIALLQVVWTENYDMRWGMIFTRISLHFLSLILLILLI